jgi:hypothetical protein
MTVYVLEAYNTDSRYPNDIRYREYTTSKTRADLFNKIPKIQFSDSGHGIVFWSHEHKGKRKELRRELSSYVFENLLKLKPITKKQKRLSATSMMLYEALKKIVDEGTRCLLQSSKPIREIYNIDEVDRIARQTIAKVEEKS